MKKYITYPLVPISISFALGITISDWVSPSTSLILFLLFFTFLFLILSFSYKKNSAFTYITLIFFSLLGIFIYQIRNEKNNSNHYSNFEILNKNCLKIEITSLIKPNKNFNKYLAHIKTFNQKSSVGKILLNFNKNLKPLVPGETLLIYEKVVPIVPSLNPNQFDYAAYMKNQDVFHQLYINEKASFKNISLSKNLNYFTHLLRTKLSKSFTIHHFPDSVESLINALVLGQRQEMDAKLLYQYTQAGVIHILAISGLHVGILYGFLSFIFQFLNRSKYSLHVQVVLIVSFLWIFALVSGMSASVVRAVLMFTFIAIGRTFNTRTSLFNALAVSFLLLLLVNPKYLFDVGFQLSYIAVLSILCFQPFFARFYFSRNKIVVYVIDIILVSLVAQIGVLPLSLYYFKQIPLLFLASNIIVIPLSSAVLILGIILLFLNLTVPSFALVLGKIVQFLVELMNNYISYIASIPNGVVKNISFTSSLTLCLYLIICAILFVLYQKNISRWYALFCAILFFQVSYWFTKNTQNKGKEWIIFHSKNSIIGYKDTSKTTFYVDSIDNNNTHIISSYLEEKFSTVNNIHDLQNLYYFEGKKILVIDSNGITPKKHNADIVFLRQKPKLNLDRYVKQYKPKIVVSDYSNGYFLENLWKKTCKKHGILFHATSNDGYFLLK